MSDHLCPTGLHTEPSHRCYGAHRCRCEGCRASHSTENRARAARAAKREGIVTLAQIKAERATAVPGSGDTHGCVTGLHPNPTYTCYRLHECRCDGCIQVARPVRGRTPDGRSPARNLPPLDPYIDVKVPREAWYALAMDLQARGVTTDEFIRALATKAKAGQRQLRVPA